MEIRIRINKHKSIVITFGKNLPWHQSKYAITIIGEIWGNELDIVCTYFIFPKKDN